MSGESMLAQTRVLTLRAMPIPAWYRRFDAWLRGRAQRHVESDAYKRREKALYDSTRVLGESQGWKSKKTDKSSDPS
jgi:hypothetical protein